VTPPGEWLELINSIELEVEVLYPNNCSQIYIDDINFAK
jgi:hypothetical protein